MSKEHRYPCKCRTALYRIWGWRLRGWASQPVDPDPKTGFPPGLDSGCRKWLGPPISSKTRKFFCRELDRTRRYPISRQPEVSGSSWGRFYKTFHNVITSLLVIFLILTEVITIVALIMPKKFYNISHWIECYKTFHNVITSLLVIFLILTEVIPIVALIMPKSFITLVIKPFRM